MPDRYSAGPKGLQFFVREHLAYKAKFSAGAESAVVVDHYPRALLASVLEGVQSVVNYVRKVEGCPGPYPEHPAFFA